MTENDLLNREKAFHAVARMDIPRLTKYIEERLKGTKILPPLNTRSDETPEYFLEKLYERSDDDEFKERFHHSIAVLLASEQIKISNPDYLALLLIFCEQYLISEAVGPVAGLALSEKLKGKPSIEGDLHLRALMALARMPQGMNMTDIWKNAIDDERYTAAAFAALRVQGLEIICKYLPFFVRIYQKIPGSIDLKIAILILFDDFKDNYPETDIAKCIVKSFENEDPTIRDIVENILKGLGKKCPETPSRQASLYQVLEFYDKTLEELVEKKGANLNRIFSIYMGFVFLLLEIGEVESAHYFLNKSVRLPVSLDEELKLIPYITKKEKLAPLKNVLRRQALSMKGDEAELIYLEIKAWKIIAKIEKNPILEERWNNLENQYKHGTLGKVRY